MSIRQVRNDNFKPFIDEEGFFNGRGLKDPPEFDECRLWYENLEPHVRLYHHNTLSSTRRHANFVNVRSPKDSLDVVLSSEYNQSDDLFNAKEEVFKQPEVNNKKTFRRLRNTEDIFIKPPVYLSHPLKKGGTTERLSIHSVKLINSGTHSQITNHGYSRQSVDGNFFNY